MSLKFEKDYENDSFGADQEDFRDAVIVFSRSEGIVKCTLKGNWSIQNRTSAEVQRVWSSFLFKNPTVTHYRFNLHSEISWDSTFGIISSQMQKRFGVEK